MQNDRVFLPLPELPKLPTGSPNLVLVLDTIRNALDEDEKYAEFYWFAREYPRVFRHHCGHARYRLREIHSRYLRAREKLVEQVLQSNGNTWEISVEDEQSYAIHWDFEAFLSAINSALDVLARVVGTAYEEHTPPSFNKLCGKTHLQGCAELFRSGA